MNINLMLQLMRQLEQLRKHEQWTRAELEAYQITALKALRDYAYTKSVLSAISQRSDQRAVAGFTRIDQDHGHTALR